MMNHLSSEFVPSKTWVIPKEEDGTVFDFMFGAVNITYPPPPPSVFHQQLSLALGILCCPFTCGISTCGFGTLDRLIFDDTRRIFIIKNRSDWGETCPVGVVGTETVIPYDSIRSVGYIYTTKNKLIDGIYNEEPPIHVFIPVIVTTTIIEIPIVYGWFYTLKHLEERILYFHKIVLGRGKNAPTYVQPSIFSLEIR